MLLIIKEKKKNRPDNQRQKELQHIKLATEKTCNSWRDECMKRCCKQTRKHRGHKYTNWLWGETRNRCTQSGKYESVTRSEQRQNQNISRHKSVRGKHDNYCIFFHRKTLLFKIIGTPRISPRKNKSTFELFVEQCWRHLQRSFVLLIHEKHFELLQIFVFVQVDVYDYYLAERCILWPDLNFLTDSAKVSAWCNPSFSKPLSMYCRYPFTVGCQQCFILSIISSFWLDISTVFS